MLVIALQDRKDSVSEEELEQHWPNRNELLMF